MTREVIADVFIVKTHTYPFQEWDFEGCYATQELAKKVDVTYLSLMSAIPCGIDRKIERSSVVLIETPLGWRLKETPQGAIVMVETSFNRNSIQAKVDTLTQMVKLRMRED
jgi:hypothetical protein